MLRPLLTATRFAAPLLCLALVTSGCATDRSASQYRPYKPTGGEIATQMGVGFAAGMVAGPLGAVVAMSAVQAAQAAHHAKEGSEYGVAGPGTTEYASGFIAPTPSSQSAPVTKSKPAPEAAPVRMPVRKVKKGETEYL